MTTGNLSGSRAVSRDPQNSIDGLWCSRNQVLG